MKYIAYLFIFISLTACSKSTVKENSKMENSKQNSFNVQKSEEEWKEELSPEQFAILRQAGTEMPHSGKYNMHFEEGVYKCGACGEPLFTSESKFDGHCGWPSFDKEIEEGKIVERLDKSHGMLRTEIVCANCGSHLGHIFEDGPTETGLRYCVNSLSLDFEEDSIK